MLGFERLTADNWTDPDPVNRHFARISPIAGPISMEGGDWAREFLAVSVADHVPGEEVADLFAITGKPHAGSATTPPTRAMPR